MRASRRLTLEPFKRGCPCTTATSRLYDKRSHADVAIPQRASITRRMSTLPNGERHVVDLRSETVAPPSRPMMETALTAKTGDDVYGEDPSVLELESTVAALCGKSGGLFVPTSTMANLVALMAHCHGPDKVHSNVMAGLQSYVYRVQAKELARMARIHVKAIREDQETAQIDVKQVTEISQNDHHDERFTGRIVEGPNGNEKTPTLLCLENTHTVLGGAVLTPSYMEQIKNDSGFESQQSPASLRIHVDGARLWNAAVALQCPLSELCAPADSVSLCLSKGLGVPMGSVLVSDDLEFLRLAKRARKRCGGGMRQIGVVAAMGQYAVEKHYGDERSSILLQDHLRAQRLAAQLQQHGLLLSRSLVETNLFYFALPSATTTSLTATEFVRLLEERYQVRLLGGYGPNRELIRVCTHKGITDDDVAHAAASIVKLCYG